MYQSLSAFPINIPLLDEDLQELRAKELIDLQLNQRAERLLKCSNETLGLGKRTCKQRLCFICSQRIAVVNAKRVREAIESMAAPYLTIATLRSAGPWTLAATVTEFRAAVTKLRRRAFFRTMAAAGIGALETKLTEDQKAWNVHAHLIIDSIEPDIEACKQAWSEITKGRGRFVAHSPNPRPASALSVANYITKADTWCPPPNSIPKGYLAQIASAIHGRRLIIRWP